MKYDVSTEAGQNAVDTEIEKRYRHFQDNLVSKQRYLYLIQKGWQQTRKEPTTYKGKPSIISYWKHEQYNDGQETTQGDALRTQIYWDMEDQGLIIGQEG